VPVSYEIVEKGGFGPPNCRGSISQISDIHFHSLPSIWPVLVEFRSASSEDSGRKKDEEDRMVVKPVCPSTTMSGGLINMVTHDKVQKVAQLSTCKRTGSLNVLS